MLFLGIPPLTLIRRGKEQLADTLWHDYITYRGGLHNSFAIHGIFNRKPFFLSQVWNPALATEAQYWAEECQFKHGSSDIPINKTYDVLGQNLYYTTAGELNVTRAVLDWYAEKSGYHHETQKCSISMCGHYTQVSLLYPALDGVITAKKVFKSVGRGRTW